MRNQINLHLKRSPIFNFIPFVIGIILILIVVIYLYTFNVRSNCLNGNREACIRLLSISNELSDVYIADKVLNNGTN